MMKYSYCLILLLLQLSIGAQPKVTIKKEALGINFVDFKTTCYGNSDFNVLFINVHENENTSIKAAKQVLVNANNYCLTELQYRKMRLINFTIKGSSFTVDPNRIFTPKGIQATLKKYSQRYNEESFAAAQKSVSQLSETFTSNSIDNRKLVVALHNNTNGEPLSIISYKSGNESHNAKEVFMNLQQDPDDFFLTTEKGIFDFLKSKGFNVALQDNEKVEDDGSLSVYAGKKHIPYINIEAQQGHMEQQEKMVAVVLEYIQTIGK